MADSLGFTAVSEQKDGTWDFVCPVSGCDPFRSTGWPTKKLAVARGRGHLDEHEGKSTGQSLEDFRAEHGVSVTADGKAVQNAKDA
jgi:hypothetical protein